MSLLLITLLYCLWLCTPMERSLQRTLSATSVQIANQMADPANPIPDPR